MPQAAKRHPLDSNRLLTESTAAVPCRTPLAALSVGLLIVAIGCAPERDPLGANQALGPDDRGATTRLEPQEHDAVRESLRAAFEGAPIERPTPAKFGVRWSDVPAAAYWGALKVEMAIVTQEISADRALFQLVTVRDEPATLVVERVDPPECVRVAATVGTFQQRVNDARQLEQAFREALDAFGRKPGFE